MALTKEDLSRMKLPLSDDDYLMLHEGLRALRVSLRREFPDLWVAYNKKMAWIYDQRHPGNNLSWDEIPWEPPLTEEEKARLAK